MSEIKRQKLHKTGWITISMDEYDSMRTTIEVLSDKEIMEQIIESQIHPESKRPFSDIVTDLKL